MNRAFTLLETLITVALFAVIMFAVTQLYVVYGRVISLQKSSIGVALDGSSIIDAVRTAGLQASHVVVSHTFSGVTLSSGTTTVVFEIPSIDATGAILGGAYDYIAVYASSTSAYRATDGAVGSARIDGNKRLTATLSALTFSYDSLAFPSVASVTVNATTTATVRGQVTQTHVGDHVYLRNL